METNKQIEQLEALFFDRLGQEESNTLRAQLESDGELATEATAYQTLWTGFDSLRGDRLLQQMQQWEAEWNTIADDELAEWYWMGELSAENKSKVEARRDEDTAFATLLAEQEQLTQGLQQAGKEAFLDRMASWEQANATAERPTARLRTLYVRRLAAAAAIALLIFVGGRWYASQNYGNEVLANQYYQTAATGGTLGAQETDRANFLQSFDEAHQALQQADYATAAQAFASLSGTIADAGLNEEDQAYYQDNIDWNLILARLGADQTDGDFTAQLNQIADQAGHSFQAEAKALRADLNSFWRRW